MKRCLLFAVLSVLVCAATAQEKPVEKTKEKVKEKVEQKKEQKAEEVEQKVDEAIDSTLEKGEDLLKSLFKKKEPAPPKEKAVKSGESQGEKEKSGATSSGSADDFKSFSKFDFVPGEQVIFYEDFSQDAIGDFPPNWDTDGTGEVVTIGAQKTRWLKWSAGASYAPLLKNPFPDNYTFEFDILLRKGEDQEDPSFDFGVYSTERNNLKSEVKAMAKITASGGWNVNVKGADDESEVGSSKQIEISDLFGKVAHISVWVQKTRLRTYVNETKILDLPRAIPEGFKYNQIRYSNNPGLNLSNDQAGEIYVSNVRVAVGAPDMRSKLITEGKLVTRGILFDVNSDKIKPASYGVLKEIGTVLKENPTVNVRIIGHTDSDGDDKANLDLSKRRAAAVKNSLSTDFGIDASRIQTDGKGESQPASPNTTPEGKANNRRVEFIKL